MTDIEKNNRIIAEWMGNDYTPNQWKERYSTDWDWLMPVVDKIEKMGYDSRIIFNDDDKGYLCDFCDEDNNELSCETSGQSKIDAVYKAVISAITWLNSLNDKNTTP